MNADLFPDTLPNPAPTCEARRAPQVHPAAHYVSFRDTSILCLTAGDAVFVAMRPVVEGMGLAWQTQHRKLTALAERFCITFMVTQLPDDDQAREYLCIPLERLFGWLMTIHPTRVKPALRDKVIAYQRECDRVLFHHFHHELQVESHALRLLRPTTVAVAQFTQQGLSRLAIAARLGKSPASISYHRRAARRLGLLAA